MQVSTHTSLVNPNDVHVAQPQIFSHAQPIMTPLERVRRADEQLLHVLLYKQQALAEWGGYGAVDEINALATLLADKQVGELRTSSSCREMVLSAVVHANRLLDAINEGMRLCEELPTPQVMAGDQSVARTPLSPFANAPAVLGAPSVPCLTLTAIAAPLLKHLTALMSNMQSMEEEMKRARMQLAQLTNVSQMNCDRQS